MGEDIYVLAYKCAHMYMNTHIYEANLDTLLWPRDTDLTSKGHIPSPGAALGHVTGLGAIISMQNCRECISYRQSSFPPRKESKCILYPYMDKSHELINMHTTLSHDYTTKACIFLCYMSCIAGHTFI